MPPKPANVIVNTMQPLSVEASLSNFTPLDVMICAAIMSDDQLIDEAQYILNMFDEAEDAAGIARSASAQIVHLLVAGYRAGSPSSVDEELSPLSQLGAEFQHLPPADFQPGGQAICTWLRLHLPR